MVGSSKKFDFKNKDEQTLSGRLELPAANSVAYAIFAHCFTCSKNILAATRISKHLSQLGIAVLRFDFTGLGNSEGDFANTNFSSNVEDLVYASKALAEKFEEPQLLIGHSLGGAAVLKAAQSIPSTKAVVTIGAPSDVSHVSHILKNSTDEIELKGEADVDIEGRVFKIKKQFIEDINQHALLQEITNLKKAFLIMHSPLDNTVSIDHAAAIFQAVKHPKSFISLDNADHLIKNPSDAEFVANTIAAWVERYIECHKIDEKYDDQITVVSRSSHQYTHDIYSKNHHIVADEPKHVQGDDLGMNPYDLLLSSLGACTAMTMKMYAKRKGIVIDKIKVQLNHEKKHFDDCETCGDGPKTLDTIEKKIHIEGNMTDDQKQRILEIAEKCPVNRTLQSEIKIISTTD